jgi:hypothetical protein
LPDSLGKGFIKKPSVTPLSLGQPHVQAASILSGGKEGPQTGRSRGLLMTRVDKALLILLRFVGVSAMFALVAVFMPLSWLTATHRWLGMGEMPAVPVVEYLARSLSAFYALVGALCLVVTADLDRYRPLVRFLAVAFALMSVVILGVDLAAGMPSWWSAPEGPGGVAFGVLMFFLARTASKGWISMTPSLRLTCSSVREIVSPKAKGSRFLLCQLSQTNPDYPKYAPQPVVRCDGYQKKERLG